MTWAYTVAMRQLMRTIDPEEILRELLALDPALRRERYYDERAIFYNPDGAAPLGVIFASIKDREGPNDSAAALARAGVSRLAFGLTRATLARLFGAVPARPAKAPSSRCPGTTSPASTSSCRIRSMPR
jgi:hypothetical protein